MKHPKKRETERPPITKPKEAAGFQNNTPGQIDDQSRVLHGFSEGIASFAIQEDVAAAEIMKNLTGTTSSSSVNQGDDPAESFRRLTETDSNGDGYNHDHRVGRKVNIKSRQNKVIAASGIVSTVLGKDYVPKRIGFASQEIAMNSFHVRGSHPPSGPKTSTQQVLESLFNSKHLVYYPSEDTAIKQHIRGKGDRYQNYMNTTTQHSDSTKDATAYASGRQNFAPSLSEIMEIMESRDKEFKNVITVHLCRQKVKFGLKILMLHLVFAEAVGTVHAFRVITGCESHGLGGLKLKHAIVDLLEAGNIEWKEENRSTLLINPNGQREFSLSDSGSDSE